MHVHTRYSADALSSVKSAIKTAIRKGLDAIAITDHDTGRAWKEAKTLSKKLGFPVILGEEIRIVENGKTLGEILGYFLNSEIKPGNAMEIIDEIKSQGGIASVSHPFDAFRNPIKTRDVLKRVQAVEVFNSRVIFDSHNRRALEFAMANKKTFTAGSDAHISWEIGNAYTLDGSSDLEGFRESLIKGKTGFYGKRSGLLVHVISTLAKVRI